MEELFVVTRFSELSRIDRMNAVTTNLFDAPPSE